MKTLGQGGFGKAKLTIYIKKESCCKICKFFWSSKSNFGNKYNKQTRR